MTLSASPSELAKFQRCRRQWALTYYYKWGVDHNRTSPVGAALLGTRIHAAMEGYYGYDIDPFTSLGVIYDTAREQRPECEPELTKEQDYATIMISGYLDWASENGLDEEHEVIATERELMAPVHLSNGDVAIVHGKLDQIVRRRLDGTKLLRDWKTVGTLGKANLIVLDPQMRIYSALLDITEAEVRTDGALFTMMLRSKRTARATGPFYEQIHINYNATDRATVMTRVTGILEDMARVVAQLDDGMDPLGVVYPNPMTDRCAWDCPFVQVCPLFDDGSRVEAALEANFIKDADPYGYRKLDLLGQVKATLGVGQGADEQ